MNILVFSLFFTLGVIVWNTILLGGGFTLGKQWSRIVDWLRIYNIVVISVIALAIASFLAWRIYRKRKVVQN